jgi:hypothetical protein
MRQRTNGEGQRFTMTSAAERRPAHDELTIRVFRALYDEFDLYNVAGTHVAVPKGTSWFCSVSLGSIARQISEHEPNDGVAQTRRPGTSEDGTLRP